MLELGGVTNAKQIGWFYSECPSYQVTVM